MLLSFYKLNLVNLYIKNMLIIKLIAKIERVSLNFVWLVWT